MRNSLTICQVECIARITTYHIQDSVPCRLSWPRNQRMTGRIPVAFPRFGISMGTVSVGLHRSPFKARNGCFMYSILGKHTKDIKQIHGLED